MQSKNFGFVFPKLYSIAIIRCSTAFLLGIVGYAIFTSYNNDIVTEALIGRNEITLSLVLVSQVALLGLLTTWYRKMLVRIMVVLMCLAAVVTLFRTNQNIVHQFFNNENTCETLIQQGGFLKDLIEMQSEDLYQFASHNFCTENCPCNVTNPIIIQELNKSEKGKHINQWTGTNNIARCQHQETMQQMFQSDQSIELFRMTTLFEHYFNCSGFCQKQDIFYFSDINKGFPTDSCFKYWRSVMEEMLSPYVKLGLMSFVFIWIVFLFYMCWFFKEVDESGTEKYDVNSAKKYLANKDKNKKNQTEDQKQQQQAKPEDQSTEKIKKD